MPIDYNQIASIAPAFLDARQQRMQNSLVQRNINQQDANANALRTWGENPNDPNAVNTLASVDPAAAAHIANIQAARQQQALAQQRMAADQQAEAAEQKKQQSLEVLSRMQYVLKSDKPSLALQLGGKLSTGEDLVETLTQQGLIDPKDGLDDDESRKLAQAIHDRVSQSLGLGPDGLPVGTVTKTGTGMGEFDELVKLSSGPPGPARDAARIKLGMTPRATSLTESDPDKVEHLAQMIATGQMGPITGVGLKSAFGQDVMTRVGEINPNYQGGGYNARAATIKGFTAGKQGDTVRSLNVAISHLDTLNDLIPALKNGELKGINRIINSYKEQTGNTATSGFEAAKGIVADEITKAIVGGASALGDREEMKSKLDNARSPEQLEAVIKTFQELMAGQLGGLRRQYTEGSQLDDFDRFLAPETKSRLGKLEQAHAARELRNAPIIPGSAGPPDAADPINGLTPEQRQKYGL